MLATLGVMSLAHAEPTDQDRALATTLFNEGKSLLADGNVPAACRKLEESRRLDPLPGTILNLADCHEKEGLLASASAEYRDARTLAARDGRSDRVALANARLEAIAPMISHLVIVVAPEVDLANLRISRDTTLLGRAAWGTRIPVDPGEHVIEASAPGKKTTRTVVTVGREGDVQTFVLAALEDEAPPAPPPSTNVAPEPETPTVEPRGLSTRRTIALASAGIGVAALGVGTYFGLSAIDKHGDPEATCTTTPCSTKSVSLNEQAKFAADAATVTFAVGLLALGGAAFLWFSDSPPRARPTAHVRLSPAIRPGDSRLELSGSF